MKRTPRRPPHKAIIVISIRLGSPITSSFAHKNNAGKVKIAPAASDSPADPIV